jgi:hypothetical protein
MVRMPSRTGALLPLFMLLHSSSALLTAARSPQQLIARSASLLQLGASSAPPTSAAAATELRLTMRRGPLLRAILGACSIGPALPALAAEAPCVDVDSASAKDLEALKGAAAWSKVIPRQVLQLGSCTSSGRAQARLRAAPDTQGERPGARASHLQSRPFHRL